MPRLPKADTTADTAFGRLVPQHQAFVLAYLGESNFNAGDAARRAGCSTVSGQSLRVAGHRIYKRADVQAAIREVLEGAKSTAEESIARTIRRAKGTLADYFEVKHNKSGKVTEATFSLKIAFETGAIHNAKKLKQGKYGWEVELSDPAVADLLLLRAHGKLDGPEEEAPNPHNGPARRLRYPDVAVEVMVRGGTIVPIEEFQEGEDSAAAPVPVDDADNDSADG